MGPTVAAPGPTAPLRRVIGTAGAATLLAALALAGAGCSTPGSGIQAGEHVTVYVSMPLRGSGAVDGRDVVRGAKLALADAHGKVGQLGVRAVYLDDTAGRGAPARRGPALAAPQAPTAAPDSPALPHVRGIDSPPARASPPRSPQA